MTFVGVVCGLKSEASAAHKAIAALSGAEAQFRVGVSGANAARAAAIAGKFAEEGARALLSVGVSGGLDPELPTGALVATADIRGAEGRIPVRAASLAPMITRRDERAPWLFGAPVFGSDVIIQSTARKAALFAETGAVAVDMESHVVARAAAAAGLPFLAVRTIADPASRALPNAALDAVSPDGSPRIIATLLKCAASPSDFPALLQLGADSSTALKALGHGLGLFLGGLLLRLDL